MGLHYDPKSYYYYMRSIRCQTLLVSILKSSSPVESCLLFLSCLSIFVPCNQPASTCQTVSCPTNVILISRPCLPASGIKQNTKCLSFLYYFVLFKYIRRLKFHFKLRYTLKISKYDMYPHNFKFHSLNRRPKRPLLMRL